MKLSILVLMLTFLMGCVSNETKQEQAKVAVAEAGTLTQVATSWGLINVAKANSVRKPVFEVTFGNAETTVPAGMKITYYGEDDEDASDFIPFPLLPQKEHVTNGWDFGIASAHVVGDILTNPTGLVAATGIVLGKELADSAGDVYQNAFNQNHEETVGAVTNTKTVSIVKDSHDAGDVISTATSTSSVVETHEVAVIPPVAGETNNYTAGGDLALGDITKSEANGNLDIDAGGGNVIGNDGDLDDSEADESGSHDSKPQTGDGGNNQ